MQQQCHRSRIGSLGVSDLRVSCLGSPKTVHRSYNLAGQAPVEVHVAVAADASPRTVVRGVTQSLSLERRGERVGVGVLSPLAPCRMQVVLTLRHPD